MTSEAGVFLPPTPPGRLWCPPEPPPAPRHKREETPQPQSLRLEVSAPSPGAQPEPGAGPTPAHLPEEPPQRRLVQHVQLLEQDLAAHEPLHPPQALGQAAFPCGHEHGRGPGVTALQQPGQDHPRPPARPTYLG